MSKITALADNQIFVFGSNRLGAHYGGAAYQAHQDFGAETGVGEGRTGSCWAFPTLDENMKKVSQESLEASRDKLYQYAQANPDLVFFLTKVGCGIAGFSEETIKKLFDVVPDNIIKPKEWQ